MGIGKDILKYNEELETAHRTLAQMFCDQIEKAIPQAEAKVWHGHPVWFLNGNPVAGYSLKKSGLEVLFWSGQSFKTPGLKAIGKFQAAGFPLVSNEDAKALEIWFQEAIAIQWDYANLPKKRSLEKLTTF